MRYADVVKKAQEIVSKRGADNKSGKVPLYACKTWLKGDQINLWSYWQGYQIKDMDKGIDILLVGQDWGNPDRYPDSVSRIEEIQAGNMSVNYFSDASKTDENLAELFEILGCNIRKPVYDKRILFTNYCLGYRKGKESGGMTKTQLSMDKELFNDLVEAVKPKIIICLGKIVYEAVTGRVAHDFSKQISAGLPFVSEYPGDKHIKVYGVAHCGALGCNNAGGLDNMKKAWRVSAKDNGYLENVVVLKREDGTKLYLTEGENGQLVVRTSKDPGSSCIYSADLFCRLMGI
ncbi:MAG: uracil-DNA glycosylase family protein [Lachnospiraceae bacterium]|nr:uracil-DNA glycosylase family protein [Lachnospiraceae bacterium]